MVLILVLLVNYLIKWFIIIVSCFWIHDRDIYNLFVLLAGDGVFLYSMLCLYD